MVARALGSIIWDAYISLRPLFLEKRYIDFMKPNVTTVDDWSSSTPLNAEDREVIVSRLRIMQQNDWKTYQERALEE